jgi:acylphosphatase
MGNDVMTNPKVVPIYWGNTILGSAAMKTAFDQFFAELLNSDYVDRLAQYNVGQPVVMPSHAIGGTATSVSSSDVATQLTTWFGNNTIPMPDPIGDAANWYYVILAPPGATVGSPGECGYHSNSNLTIDEASVDLAWGLVFFPPPASGATPESIVNSVCYCLVHEMVEAFTNPRGEGWSVNVPSSGGNQGQNCEIGDLCESKTFHNVGRWSVETYWSNQDLGCVGTFGPDWVSLGAPGTGVLGAPVVGHELDARLEVFVVSTDGDLWHNVQSAPNGSWGSWRSVVSSNPGISAPPRVGYNQDGRMEVYGLQSGGVLWHVWQTAVNGGWSDGGTLGAPSGGIIGGVTVANNQDGRIEIFAVGSDHQLHHVWQTSPNNGWNGWDSLGAPGPGISIGDPRVIQNADGRLEVFLLADDQNIWHIWQTSANNGWSGWASLGGPAVSISNGAPFVGNNADGRIEVFVTGTDGGIYHIWQTSPSNGWGTWAQLQAPLAGIQLDGLGGVSNNEDGRFQLFFIGSDGALWTLAQTSPSNGWGAVRFLDGVPPGQALNGEQIPASGLNANGNLAAFVAGADGDIWQIFQISPGGTWGSLVQDLSA